MDGRQSEAPPAAMPLRLRRLPSWLILQLSGPANRLVSSHLAQAESRADFALLACLEEFGPQSQADLGRRLAVDRSDMVALVNRLEHNGLALRRRDEGDRRRNAISITSSGRHALIELDRDIADAQNEVVAPLSPAERDTLIELLQRLVDHHRSPRTPDQA